MAAALVGAATAGPFVTRAGPGRSGPVRAAQRIGAPEIARAMTRRWISLVPSNTV